MDSKTRAGEMVVAGVGGAGVNAILRLADHETDRVRLVAVDSSAQALSRIRDVRQVLLTRGTGGWGTGGDVELGRQAVRAGLGERPAIRPAAMVGDHPCGCHADAGCNISAGQSSERNGYRRTIIFRNGDHICRPGTFAWRARQAALGLDPGYRPGDHGIADYSCGGANAGLSWTGGAHPGRLIHYLANHYGAPLTRRSRGLLSRAV